MGRTTALRWARGACAAGAIAMLTGCPLLRSAQKEVGELRNADMMEQPTEIGPDPGQLRRSPCACIELEVGPYGKVG